MGPLWGSYGSRGAPMGPLWGTYGSRGALMGLMGLLWSYWVPVGLLWGCESVVGLWGSRGSLVGLGSAQRWVPRLGSLCCGVRAAGTSVPGPAPISSITCQDLPPSHYYPPARTCPHHITSITCQDLPPSHHYPPARTCPHPITSHPYPARTCLPGGCFANQPLSCPLIISCA